jgi:hypothetical protein
MGGFNRDIGVGIMRSLRWQNYAQPLKQKAGYKVNGSLLIAFFSLGFRVSRPLIQAMY